MSGRRLIDYFRVLDDNLLILPIMEGVYKIINNVIIVLALF